jgi:phage N-6-adenine-methyltransferase
VKETDVRSTPQALFDELDNQWEFILDAAADETNHKCPRWYGPGGEVEDALSVAWPIDGPIWLNPPYSRGLQRKFVEKAIECSQSGGCVVALLPADTSTRLFHELIYGKYEVTFLKGRLKFNGMKQAAKFGSMLVVF